MSVTEQKTFSIRCSEHGCETSVLIQVDADYNDPAEIAWHRTKELFGWAENYGEHRCPDHRLY